MALDGNLMTRAMLPPLEPVFTLLAGTPQPIPPGTEPRTPDEPLPRATEARDTRADEDRADRIKAAATAALVMAPGSTPADTSHNPAGMANGTTVSLLARGFVKFAPGLGQDRPQLQLTAGEPDDLQRVDRVAQVALGLGHSGQAPTPDRSRTSQGPQNGFLESAEAAGLAPSKRQ